MKSAILGVMMGIGIGMATLGAARADTPPREEFHLGYSLSMQVCSATLCTNVPGKITRLTVNLEKSSQSSSIREVWEGQAFAEFQVEAGAQRIPLLARVQITKQTNRGSSDYWISASISAAASSDESLAELSIGTLSEDSLPLQERVSTQPVAKTETGLGIYPLLRVGSPEALASNGPQTRTQ